MLVLVHITKHYLFVVISFKDHAGVIQWEVFIKVLFTYLFRVWAVLGELKHLIDVRETNDEEWWRQ